MGRKQWMSYLQQHPGMTRGKGGGGGGATYTISGDIVDGLGDPVEGVTVDVLTVWTVSGYLLFDNDDPAADSLIIVSGDEDHEIYTDENGFYSITIPDGDYTFTPDAAGFVPNHVDVTVAGEDVALGTMTSPLVITIPFCYAASGMSVGDTVDLPGNEPGWYSALDTVANPVYECQVDGLTTGGNIGISKAIQNIAGDTKYSVSYFDFPNGKVMPAGLTGFRCAMTLRQSLRTGLGGGPHYIYFVGTLGAALQAGGAFTNFIRFGTQSFNYNEYYYADSRNNSETQDSLVNQASGTWIIDTQWQQFRCEVNYATKTIKMGVGRYNNGEAITMNEYTGKTALPDLSPQFTTVGIVSANVDRYNMYAGFWIGSLTDTWPVVTSWPATTEPWV